MLRPIGGVHGGVADPGAAEKLPFGGLLLGVKPDASRIFMIVHG